MTTLKLALLKESDRIGNVTAYDREEFSEALKLSRWLIRTLAHIAGGTEVLRAFGAPGDWGYGTPIGDALRKTLEARSASIARARSSLDQAEIDGRPAEPFDMLQALKDRMAEPAGAASECAALETRERALTAALQLVLDDWANANAIGDDAREQAERALSSGQVQVVREAAMSATPRTDAVLPLLKELTRGPCERMLIEHARQLERELWATRASVIPIKHRRLKMTLTEQERREFEALTRPVIEWLNKTCHPHVSIVIEPTRAELLEGMCAFSTNDYLRD